MKRAGLEVSMWQLEPSKFASMKEFIDKVQIMQQEIMHVEKKIASKDLAILLLSKLPATYSALRLTADPQLYIHKADSLVMAIVIYVDDLIISEDDQGFISTTKQKFHAQFDMTDLGLLHFFLGLEIWQHS